jgi:DNA-binding NtrC family response regulator
LRILIVDDDPVALRLTSGVAERAGFSPLTATGGEEALRILRSDPGIGAVVLDLVMPDLDGMAVMEIMAREGMTAPVIIQTAHSELETIVSATRKGAVDFFVKPVAPERLIVSLTNAVQLRALQSVVRGERARRDGTIGLAEIVTKSPTMDRVLALCARAAKSSMPVLIEGEAGTGKDLIARVIHSLGSAGRTLMPIDCAAGPPPAVGGPLLLDEIGELNAAGQAQLMTMLDGGARVISTTSRRLLNLARSGAFREDLYYRLTVLPIYVPPLRERREDIPLLCRHFLARATAETGNRTAGVSADAMALLEAYAWPGNVRQLEGAIHRAVAMSEAAELQPVDFPNILAAVSGREQARKLTESLPTPSVPVHIDTVIPLTKSTGAKDSTDRFLTAKGDVAALSDLERDLIAFAIQHYAGRMSRAARALRIGRSTLYRKLKEYGLDDGIESNAA